MSRNQLLFAILVLALIGVGVGVFLRPASTPLEPKSAEDNPTPIPSSTPAPFPSPLTSPSPANLSTSAFASAQSSLQIPTLRDVREQVAKNPHETPPALLQFAKDLSAQAEAAKASPEAASRFFETLEGCAQNREARSSDDLVPVAAQTLCLTTADEFSKLYPEKLGERNSRLQENASPQAKKIRSALDRLSQ
jgi:hypothetical protein